MLRKIKIRISFILGRFKRWKYENRTMTKVLFLIMSGDEKFELAMRMAYNSAKNKRYEDVKVA